MAQTTDVQTEELRVPEVGESITEVVIGQWHKQEGDAVERDEELVELESEKATFEAPAPIAGTLIKILKQPGDSAEVGEVIAYIGPAGGSAPSGGKPAEKPQPATEPEAASPNSSGSSQQPDAPPAPPAARDEPIREPAPDHLGHRDRQFEKDPDRVETAARVMPAAARALGEHKISPDDVQATGPGNRMLKEDVERHRAAPVQSSSPQASSQTQSSPQPRSAGERETRKPMSPLRRHIATRLVEAQHNAALLTTFNEADLTEVKQLRKEHGEAFAKKHGVKLGFMAFFVKAVVEALKNCPELNAKIEGDELVYHNFYDIGIAIGTEKGLVVPILRDVDKMGFADIENEIARYAVLARDNKLKMSDMTGGTFTISNGGVYGSLLSTPIVNPPQSGVLGMHSIQERPIALNGQVVIRPMMYLALTYDHRIVDGREAVTFLREIKEAIEEPARILIEI